MVWHFSPRLLGSSFLCVPARLLMRRKDGAGDWKRSVALYIARRFVPSLALSAVVRFQGTRVLHLIATGVRVVATHLLSL